MHGAREVLTARSKRLALAIGVLVATTLGSAAGCALGTDQSPGCHTDADCGGGWTCREGACFRTTTPTSTPVSDAGDAGSG